MMKQLGVTIQGRNGLIPCLFNGSCSSTTITRQLQQHRSPTFCNPLQQQLQRLNSVNDTAAVTKCIQLQRTPTISSLSSLQCSNGIPINCRSNNNLYDPMRSSLSIRCYTSTSPRSSSESVAAAATQSLTDTGSNDLTNNPVKPKQKIRKSKKYELNKSFERMYKDTYNRSKTIYIKLCYTDHDLEEGDIVKAKFYWDSIVNVTSEEFGIETTNGKLEYYAEEDWIKLLPYRLYEVLQYHPCTSKHPLPLRVPKLYDEEYGTRNDIVKLKKVSPEMRKSSKEFIKMGPTSQQWMMKEMIDGIIKKCKVDGYTRSSNATLHHPLLTFQYHDTDGNFKTIEYSTREYVLDLARSSSWRLPTPEEEQEMEDAKYSESGTTRPGSSKNNPLGLKEQNRDSTIHDPDTILKKLKHVLLSQPNALQHIIECMHYDHVWQ